MKIRVALVDNFRCPQKLQELLGENYQVISVIVESLETFDSIINRLKKILSDDQQTKIYFDAEINYYERYRCDHVTVCKKLEDSLGTVVIPVISDDTIIDCATKARNLILANV